MSNQPNSSNALPHLWTVAALYQFKRVDTPAQLAEELKKMTSDLMLCGTLIVAEEGINGTVAGSRHAINLLKQFLERFFDRMEYKESTTHEKPFKRMKIKLKREIVTLGIPVEPTSTVGHYVEPEDWNDLISQDDVIVVDTRNDYEYKAGTFKNALDPQTETFREFPAWVEQHLADKKDKKIAMFCTGGIRCEKSTSLLLQQGFKEVYHLKGGILNYLEKTPAQNSLWQGECFVFDERVGVTHGVQETHAERCYGCGWPLSAEECLSPDYEKGVSCPHCIHKTSAQQKARFRMRQAQHDADLQKPNTATKNTR